MATRAFISAFIAVLCLLLGDGARADGDPPMTYRWVYRNPLSIQEADAASVDQGMGSYFGTRNSPYNDETANSPGIALQYSHGGTFAVLPNGSLATIWQASPLWWEGSMDQAAYWSLSDDNGDTWGPAVKLFQNTSNGGGPIWGPQLHVHEKSIFMFFASTAPAACMVKSVETKAGVGFPPGGDLMVMRSDDNGESWQKPQLILNGEADGGIGKLNVARLTVNAAGDWLLPFWREASGAQEGACWGSKAYSGVPGVFRSRDKGNTWQMTTPTIVPAPGTPKSKWLIENAIAPYTTANGSTGLLQVFRDNTGYVWQSDSHDDGVTWTPAAPGTLPSPDSKTDLWPLPDGSIIAAFNNITANQRRNLTLALTPDGGQTWKHLVLVEGWTPPSASPNTGTFSYPSVLYLPRANRVLVVYSVGYPPANKVSALQQYTAAVAPGVFQVNAIPSKSTAQLGLGRVRPAGPPVDLPRAFGGRKLAAASRQQRRLLQYPFDTGAWNYVSFGIRVASIDLDTILRKDTPAAVTVTG